ncbi:universal stress protein [Nonomuraea sp. NPDC049309]|uniref:universal stress protein n=1 Tax=Nonomuraea sp. NPDC049309 TaxID=3364350 RepID=UPI00370FEF10
MSRPIVVGVDGSTPSHAAVEWAAADARRRRLPLRLVHVCEQRRGSAEGLKYCEGTLQAAADRARAAGAQEVVTELLEGNVVETLLGQAVTGDSVVLGSRGVGGFAGLALGSVSLAVAGHAEGPVVVVRAGAETAAGHGKIVVGDDGSDTAREALRYAVEQARARDATVLVVYAWSQPILATYGPQFADLFTDTFAEDRDAARERLDVWSGEYPDVRFEGSQVRAHPVAALADASGSAELVVVGSRGRGGFATAVLGSVSHGLLHHAVCPVAVVRPRSA